MTMTRSLPGAMVLALLATLPVAAQLPPPPVAVPLDQKAADTFAGYYQMGPRAVMRFYREDTHFYFNTVGTPQKAETVPIASNKFAYQGGAVIITFTPGTDGKVNSATVNIGGRDVVAHRVTEEAANAIVAANRAPPVVARTWPMMTVTPHILASIAAPGNDYWPCFSPDGKTVLFSRKLQGKPWALYRVPVAGGTPEPMPMPKGLGATRAAWSPVSGRIAFNGEGNGNDGLWVMDADGSNPRRIPTEGFLAPVYPSWYPDGVTIGFGDGARNILYRVDTRGGTPVAVTRQDQVLAGMSSVSPDGKAAVFAGQKNSGQLYDQGANQIWVVDDKDESRPVEASPAQGRAPSWSPDGKRIAFESGRGSPDRLYAIFIINRDGTGLTQVTDYALNGNHPVWSPDGRRLVFSFGTPDKENGIAVVDLPK
jgi:Tol biopolymer transport system component